MSDPIGRGPLPSLTEEERGRLVMMAEKAEREVKGRRDAAEVWPEGSTDRRAEIAIASRREADAQALRAALALIERLTAGRGPLDREGLGRR